MNETRNAKITFISAGAGSGKTHRLTEILHRELTQNHVRPSGVIGTTFTKKAAAELRERVRGHLLQQGDFPLANAMGQARIGTVNSVCGQLLERFAFEAGMAPEQQVLDDVQASALLGKAIDAVLHAAAMGSFLSLVRRLGLVENLSKGITDDWRVHLKSLLDQLRCNDIPRDQIPTFALRNAADLLGHFPTPTPDPLTAQLRQAIESAMPELERVAAKGDKKNTKAYLAFLRTFHVGLINGSAAWSDWVKLSNMGPEAALKPVAEPISELAARVAEHPDLHADLKGFLTQMFDLAAKTLDIYADRKRELGMLDFADQEHLLLTLLEHPQVSEVLSDELDLLMVDEFQDTSPIQLALFLKLATFAKAVYWVGDIKQAIYGFRGSDSELMKSILVNLPEIGGAKEVLPDSWRSRPELVRLVNAVFGHAFRSSLPRDEVDLAPIRTVQLPGAPIANWILSGTNAGQEDSALATGVRRLVDSRYQVIDKGATRTRDVRFGDIAILSRSNDHVMNIAAALQSQGVPSATAQPGLLGTPEATLALACLRRLNDPADTIATAEIISLGDCIEPEVWLANRLRYLQGGGAENEWMEHDAGGQASHPLISKLAAIRRGLSLLTPAEAMQTVIAKCDLAAKIVRWDADPERTRIRLANLEGLLVMAEQYEDVCRSGQQTASISGLILSMAELAGDGKDTLAQPAIDAVKVMTHHAAKGLEWPVVVLTDLAANIKDRLWSISAQPGNAFDVRAPLNDRFIRYWPWPFGAQKKVGVADAIALTPLAEQFRHSAIEESKRLLYVSMTRARDLIVLVRSSRKLSGEWLDCVDCPWLLSEEGSEVISMPGGADLPAMRWTLDPVAQSDELAVSVNTQLHWFRPGQDAVPRLPLAFSPSNTEAAAFSVVEKCRIGERIAVSAGADMSMLGNAIHACLATSFTDPGGAPELSEIERQLSAFGVSECVSAAAVLFQVAALHDWIKYRWPTATGFAEYPVQSLLESGQILNGRLDLLLDTSDGWVLVDHKSSQLAASHWDRLATEHGAQLRAYADAIALASGKPVFESWLFLPVAAGCVRIDTGATSSI